MPDVPAAYFLTFRAYGTWLPGDPRGSTGWQQNAPGSPPLDVDASLEQRSRARLRSDAVYFDAARRAAIAEAIREVSAVREWALLALNVRTNHVHVVVQCDASPERALIDFKAYATKRMVTARAIRADVRESEAQIHAFQDTWAWSDDVQDTYNGFWMTAPEKPKQMLKAMIGALVHNDVTAYLTMMAPRLVELHRVLKSTGSLYLHCDPTASHYLKMILDSIFGAGLFRNEIVWKRSSAHNDTAQGMARLGRIHDIILFYVKGPRPTWNAQYSPYSNEYDTAEYRFIEPTTGRRYATKDVTANKPGGDTSYPIVGPTGKVVSPYNGRFWAYSRERFDEFVREGRIHWRSTAMPRLKVYADEMPGVTLQDVWTDVQPVGANATERLGYPTQKPLALLERIISASSNEGDVVLDPFCGCGTAVHAAQKLGRRWIGIDITPLATDLIRRRMEDAFPGLKVPIEGWPVDMAGAVELAGQDDKYHFQDWAVIQAGGRPAGGERKKGADKGVDGVIPFMDGNTPRRGIISVKAGNTGPAHVRELAGTVATDEDAMFGVFLCLHAPTKPMTEAALEAGTWVSEFDGAIYPRMQILSAQDLIEGKPVRMPPSRTSIYAQAGREKTGRQPRLV